MNAAVCSRDCFNCVYDDCIAENLPLNSKEYAEAKERDAEFVFYSLDDQKKKQRAYRESHKEEIAVYYRAYHKAKKQQKLSGAEI